MLCPTYSAPLLELHPALVLARPHPRLPFAGTDGIEHIPQHSWCIGVDSTKESWRQLWFCSALFWALLGKILEGQHAEHNPKHSGKELKECWINKQHFGDCSVWGRLQEVVRSPENCFVRSKILRSYQMISWARIAPNTQLDIKGPVHSVRVFDWEKPWETSHFAGCKTKKSSARSLALHRSSCSLETKHDSKAFKFELQSFHQD